MNFSKIRNVKTPNRANKGDAGIDFFFPEDLKYGDIKLNGEAIGTNVNHFPMRAKDDVTHIILKPHEDVLIPSGIKVDVPFGTVLNAFNKSGVALRFKLVRGAETIDNGYQGEVHLHLINYSNETITIKPGQKLIQFIHLPIIIEEWVQKEEIDLYNSDTTRGTGGFGSTGTN